MALFSRMSSGATTVHARNSSAREASVAPAGACKPSVSGPAAPVPCLAWSVHAAGTMARVPSGKIVLA